MSADFDRDEHLAEIFDAAIKLAPVCTGGIDFTNTGGVGRYSHGKSDLETVTDRAWSLAEAFVQRYHAEIEKASDRAARGREREIIESKRPKQEAVNG